MIKLNYRIYILIALIKSSLIHASDLSFDWRDQPVIYRTLEGKTVVNHHKIIGMERIHSSDLGAGSKIALIDTGWFDCKSDVQHSLTERTTSTLSHFSPDDQEKESEQFGHCNLVASIIAGKNGIVPKVQLEIFSVPYKFNSAKEWIDWCSASIIRAVEYQVDMMNLSIGWGHIGDSFPQEIEQALYKARDAGIGVILSASNDNRYDCVFLGRNMYIGIDQVLKNMKGYMRVAVATDYFQKEDGAIEEKIADFSNHLDIPCASYGLAAPGVSILSYGPDQKETVWSGTSASAPVISAAAIIVKNKYPELSNAEIFDRLSASARKTQFNPPTIGDYRTKKMSQPNYKNQYIRFCANKGIKRGGMFQKGECHSENFNAFIEEEYEKSIRLFPIHFGQGVINLRDFNDASPVGM